MSIILRLHELPFSANSLDVRRFFKGIKIPEGGVFIVGGEHGNVFIAFNDDDSASEAMKKTGQSIKNQVVKVVLSSRNEMQRMIKAARENLLNGAAGGDQIAGQFPEPDEFMPHPSAMSGVHHCPPGSFDTAPPMRGSSPPMQSRFAPPGPGGPPMSGPPPGCPPPPFDSRVGSGGFHGEGPSGPQFGPGFGPGPPQPPNPVLWNGPGPSGQAMTTSDSARRLTVEVHNLPLGARPEDLITFFFPLRVTEENIKIVEDERGFPTGVALVRLISPNEFNLALERNNKFLGAKPIWIKPLENHIPGPPPLPQGMPPIGSTPQQSQPFFPPPPEIMFDNVHPPPQPYPPGHPLLAGPPGMPPGPPKKLVLYMKGLPFERCKIHSIEEFFRPIQLVNIDIENDDRGRLSGNAYVEFGCIEDYEFALNEYHMKHMGNRYIELIPPNAQRQRSYCVSIVDLPSPITFDDVRDFLVRNNFFPTKIYHNDMKQEAFLEFASPKDSNMCIKWLDGKLWDGCQLSVTQIPFGQMMKRMGETEDLGPPPFQELPSPHHRSDRSPPPPPASRHPKLKNSQKSHKRNKPSSSGHRSPRSNNSSNSHPSTNIPFEDKKTVLIASDIRPDADVEDFCDFFIDHGVDPSRVKLGETSNGEPEAMIAFYNKYDAELALTSLNKKIFLGKEIRLQRA